MMMLIQMLDLSSLSLKLFLIEMSSPNTSVTSETQLYKGIFPFAGYLMWHTPFLRLLIVDLSAYAIAACSLLVLLHLLCYRVHGYKIFIQVFEENVGGILSVRMIRKYIVQLVHIV